MIVSIFFFFFQAEDGIRDSPVTGVQTCASSDLAFTLTLDGVSAAEIDVLIDGKSARELGLLTVEVEIGRASCRERV